MAVGAFAHDNKIRMIMSKMVTMILKGATRVIRYSKDGVKNSVIGFTRLDAIELEGIDILPRISAPIVKERGFEYANLHRYGPIVEVKDCDYDELALQIEIEGEFHSEWMSLYVADFKSVEMNLVDGVWYMPDGKEESWDWYDNLSSPIFAD